MNLPKIKILIRSISYVFKARPASAIVHFVSLLLNVSIDIYSISIWGKFIDSTEHFITSGGPFKFQTFFISDSFFYLALGTGFWLLSYSIDKMRYHLADDISQHLMFKVKSDYFNKISSSNLEDIESKEFRDLMTLSNSYGFTNIWNTYVTFIDIIKNLVGGISAMAILIKSVGIYSVLIVLIVIPESIAGLLGRRKIKKYQEKEIEKTKFIDYTENLMTRINTFSEMKVDGTFKTVGEEYSKKSMSYIEKFLELLMHKQIDVSFFSVLGKVAFTFYTVFIIAISLVKSLTIGRFKALYDYSYSVYESSLKIFDMAFVISHFLDYNTKFFLFLDFQGYGDRNHGDVVLSKRTPVLEFNKLDFRYSDGNSKVLENISFRVEPGERIMIIGNDSSGKSTFVKVLCGLYKITAGDFEVDGYSVKELARGELKRKISAVFQEYINYNMSLKKNVILSTEEKSINRVRFENALNISGVKTLMEKLSINENQALGKYTSGGKEVSPGFWQRLAIARMIYRNKPIMVLDEPFTYIDDQEEERILKELFKYIEREKTVIYITRDNTHRELFDRIYRLEKGKLIKG